MLNVISSTISENEAEYGGGLAGVTTLTDCIVSGNIARVYGGGIIVNGNLTVTNSMISENKAAYSGGGVYNTGTLIVTNRRINADSVQ